MGRRGRRMLGAIAAAGAMLALLPGAAAGAPPAAGKDCQEQQAFVDGDPGVVASRLPQGYTAVRNPASGRPIVFARGLRCREQTLDGRTGPVVNASYGILIESPDGRGCASGSPAGSAEGDTPNVCNWYLLAWLSSERRVVDWLRRGTPSFPAFHVPELVFDLGAFDSVRGTAPFAFRAGGPSPYTIDATFHDNTREINVRGGYWYDTPQGTVKLALSSDDLRAAGGEGVVRTAPGTELAGLMGAEERSYAPAFSPFSSVQAGHGVYRKQVLPPAGDTAGLAGVCSFKGLVTFKPTPANNETRPLGYDYTATGVCNGHLDGRDLKDAPVRLYQAGRSEGGCRGAKTTSPGVGAMTFESGEVIRYTLDFTTTSTEVSGTIYGERSGAAPGRGTFLTDRTPPDVAARCAGEGASEIPLDITFTTHRPLVDEPPPPALRLS
ncbi:MAG: hypothetical protein M3340_20095, partial [Actinomycetota bacterium]|nr:hypothetical protein [Actinomycetota bacterium]